jgi:hypothetical protein
MHLERALDKDVSLPIYAHPNEAICGGKKAAARKLSAGAAVPLYIAAPTHAQLPKVRGVDRLFFQSQHQKHTRNRVQSASPKAAL